MRVGIIVHSVTGNTLSVAENIRDNLALKGYEVNLERVTAVNEDPNSREGKTLKNAPDARPYDALIFGGPVWAFSLSSVMRAYLAQLPSLRGKKVACFVTQHFAYAWMGGNHAVRQMKKACNDKGAAIFDTGVVNWSGKNKESQIKKLIEKMLRL